MERRNFLKNTLAGAAALGAGSFVTGGSGELFGQESRGNNSIVFNIKSYGARGDGKTVNTQAINRAIDACASTGGGTVVIPAGTYMTGTIHLKSHITLLLEKGAIIKGVSDLNAYVSYTNRNSGRALILGVGVTNVTITGSGTIDGDHVFDAQGEQQIRGPHTILFSDSRNLLFSGFTVVNAANYAFLAYDIENAVYSNLTVSQGWDGIHIRRGKNITIRNSSLLTGDDAIAGGYWENMVITECKISAACNGIRMIMPAEGLTISHCTIAGPGATHRSSKEGRNNMLTAILLQPGHWVTAPGVMDKVHIHDVIINNVNTPIMMVLNEGNDAGKILVERLTALQVNAYSASVESWKGGIYDELIFRDVSFEYTGHPDASLSDASLRHPPVDSRNLPCWAWFVRNVKNFTLENVDLRLTGSDPRPAMIFDNVATTKFTGVNYAGKENPETVVFKNCGSWIVDNEDIKINPGYYY